MKYSRPLDLVILLFSLGSILLYKSPLIRRENGKEREKHDALEILNEF
jgi:hypothetical protein